MMASQYLAEKMQKPCPLPAYPPGTQGKWYDAFQVRLETIQKVVDLIQLMYDDNKSGGSAQLANSGAVAKMRMCANGGGKGSSSAGKNGAGSGGGGGGVKPDGGRGEGGGGIKRESSGEPAVKRESSGGVRGGGSGSGALAAPKVEPKAEPEEAEEGEIDEADAAPPATKRARSEGTECVAE